MAYLDKVTVSGNTYDIQDTKAQMIIGEISTTSRNLFNPAWFAAADGIELDANGFWTGTASAFSAAFGSGVTGLTFEAGKQYYFSMSTYTDANASDAANNGIQISFYSGDTRIGRKSVLNSTTEATDAELFSTAGNDVTKLTITVSNSPSNIWHLKNVMLVPSAVAVSYVPYNTAYDTEARASAESSVHIEDYSGLLVSGGYINLQGMVVGDEVTLTPVSNANIRYIITDVQAGDAFILTTTGAAASRPYAFIDAYNKITAISTGHVTWTNETIIAPESGKLIVNSLKSGDFSLYRIMNSQTIEGLVESYYVEKDRKTHRWRGAKIATFGDSRTWYDKNLYTSNAKPDLVGTICVGYQEHMRNLMMADVTNQGASGETSAQICTRIRAFDFTGYSAVLFEGGVNDFVKSSTVTIGEIAPVGSSFDTTTVYGAWQSAVEYVLTNYPGCQIYMDIPAIAWTSAGVFPYDIAKIKGEVAALYNLPCLDLYKYGGINEFNRDHWYCDNVDTTNWRLHFNDDGNALIGAKIAEFMISR